MNVLVTILFIIVIISTAVGYIFSIVKDRVIENKKYNGFTKKLLHYIFVLIYLIVSICSFTTPFIYAVIVISCFVSILSGIPGFMIEPLVNVPFSIFLASCFVILWIIFILWSRRNIKIKNSIVERICIREDEINDEALGITGNFRYVLVFILLPLSIMLYLFIIVFGIDYK